MRAAESRIVARAAQISQADLLSASLWLIPKRIVVGEFREEEPARVLRMLQDIRDKLAAIPGVSSAAFGNSVPTDNNNSTDFLYTEDRTYAEGQLPPLRRWPGRISPTGPCRPR